MISRRCGICPVAYAPLPRTDHYAGCASGKDLEVCRTPAEGAHSNPGPQVGEGKFYTIHITPVTTSRPPVGMQR